MSAAEVDLAISVACAGFGAFLLLVTSGTAGGFLVQPRSIKGMPVGQSPFPPKPTPAPKPAPKPKPKPKPKPAPEEEQGDGEGEGDGDGQGGEDKPVPPCVYDMLNQGKLAEFAAEAEPYAIARIALPWPLVNVGAYDLTDPKVAENIPLGSFGYYLTGVVVYTLVQTGKDVAAFAQGDIFFPGCLLPAGAFGAGTPLGKLHAAWKSGEGG